MYDIIYSMKKKNGDKTRKEHGGHPNWKPGESGNPKGRPKGSISITTVMKRLLQKIVKTQDGTNKQRVETLAGNILAMALNEGNEAMIKLIWNYVDGLPTQTVIGEGLQPIIQLICSGKEKDLKFPEVKE